MLIKTAERYQTYLNGDYWKTPRHTLVTPQSQNYLTLEAVEEGDLTPNFLLP